MAVAPKRARALRSQNDVLTWMTSPCCGWGTLHNLARKTHVGRSG